MIFKLFFIFSVFLYGALAIKNGEEVEIEEFPYQVSIVRKTDKEGSIQHKCGGVIMNSNWIMTINYPSWGGVGEVNTRDRVFVGSNRLNTYLENWESGHEIVKVISLIAIPDKFVGRLNGVKLIKLKNPIQMNNKTVASACFVDEKENPKPYYGKELLLSGWGIDNDMDRKASYKNILHKTKAMKDISFTDDKFNYTKLIMLDSKISSGCDGDHGGPLTYTSNEKKYVVGIHFSKTGFLCLGNGLYTRISYSLDSIKEMIDTPICIKKFNEL